MLNKSYSTHETTEHSFRGEYFDHVPSETWNLIISGYQPLDKWLKDRIGKKLSGDEIRHYQKMVVALTKTTEIMDAISNFAKNKTDNSEQAVHDTPVNKL